MARQFSRNPGRLWGRWANAISPRARFAAVARDQQSSSRLSDSPRRAPQIKEKQDSIPSREQWNRLRSSDFRRRNGHNVEPGFEPINRILELIIWDCWKNVQAVLLSMLSPPFATSNGARQIGTTVNPVSCMQTMRWTARVGRKSGWVATSHGDDAGSERSWGCMAR